MNVVQAIPHPAGISVFGSAMVRVVPDVAAITCAVVALKEKPADAFAEARAGAEAVRAFLKKARLFDAASSRVTLKQEIRWSGGNQQFAGYVARVGVQVLLRDLDRIEEVLVGLVDAGAAEIGGVEMQSTQLREARADARRKAIEAAREKAVLYCAAAGVSLGRAVHIEDVNPNILNGAWESHAKREAPVDDSGPVRAFDPGAVTVGAAVQVVYSIATSASEKEPD